MKIDETTYNKMPSELQRLFFKLPNPASEEVLQGFPDSAPSKMAMRGEMSSDCRAGECDSGPVRTKGLNTMRGHNDNGGSAARFFYCAKTSSSDREEGCGDTPTKTATELTGRSEGSKGLSGSEEHGNSTNPFANGGAVNPRKNYHPTVKPTSLMRYLCKLITPLGGLVLDPYTGSGSTGKAAILEGFGFIGMEREAEYCKIAEARIAHTTNSKGA